MIDDYLVTLINENGMIVKEKSKMIEKKTAEQIIKLFHPNDFTNFLLGIRTPTFVEILRTNLVPLERYPLLKLSDTNEDYSIPKYSLCILKESEKDKTLIVLNSVDESLKDINFPPFIYGFCRDDYSKPISIIKTEISDYFGIKIFNPQLFLDDKEIVNCTCQQFIDETIKKNNNCKILFKFKLSDEGKEKLIKRQQFIHELIDVVRKFSIDIIQFHNQVGKNVQEAHIFTELEYKTIFGSILDIFNSSMRFTTALTGNESYESSLGNIISKNIPDLEENFKEFIANYRTNELIPCIIKKYKNNQLLESIVHQTFGKSATSFESMAILPIQILPRYKLLFENIMKTTPKSHPEYFLFQININQINNVIVNLENYNDIREISFLQNRLIPLDENKNIPLDIPERSLICKYNVNTSMISKNILYLLSDLVVLTKCNTTCEVEKFRLKYDEFVFFTNLSSALIVFLNKNNQFETLKFQSVQLLKDMIEKVAQYRQEALDANPNKNNSLIAYENILEDNQSVPMMLNSTCYKINSLIVAASNGVYLTYEINNHSLDILRKVKNINQYAKLVGVENSPYIYGGEKFPIPLEFSCDRFIELKPKEKGNNKPDFLSHVVLCEQPEFGRIFHTCCSYKKYIVIFGGYISERRNQKTFISNVHFVNVKTGEWFVSKPGLEAEPEPRYKHSAVIYKNLMIIHGGISCINDQILDDTWFYNFNDGKWSVLEFGSKNSIIIPRFCHSAVMVNQFMFIIGGLTNPKRNSNNVNQIKIEQSKNSNETSNSNNNDERLNNNFIGTQNCFALDIEKCKLFGVNLIGNFLPGLSSFSSIYDDLNKQIIVLGGHYQNNKEEKYTSIFLRLSIPEFYTSSKIPNENDIKSIGRTINKKTSVLFLRKNDAQNLRNDDTKCSSFTDQNPISFNIINHADKKPTSSTPKKISFPTFFFNKNENKK